MSHYQAETIPLHYKLFKNLNDTDDKRYHYWNLIEKDFQSLPVSQLFRSDYSDPTYPQPPSTKVYTVISLGDAFVIFGAFYVIYGLVVTLFKHCTNTDFRRASHGKRLQHIIEALNVPEAFGDWDDDPTLDVNGHLKKWKKILIEMLLMTVMQFISNFILMVPLLITGIYFATLI